MRFMRMAFFWISPDGRVPDFTIIPPLICNRMPREGSEFAVHEDYAEPLQCRRDRHYGRGNPRALRLLSPFYQTFWGEHIHHGFWRGNESAAEAQENLINELAGRARVAEGDRVLDVGCGLGGSSMYLARQYEAVVKGISISPNKFPPLAITRDAADCWVAPILKCRMPTTLIAILPFTTSSGSSNAVSTCSINRRSLLNAPSILRLEAVSQFVPGSSVKISIPIRRNSWKRFGLECCAPHLGRCATTRIG